MNLPLCGAPKNKTFDSKQTTNGLASEEARKSVAMAYKCPCTGVCDSDTIGRYIGSHYMLADQSLASIQKTTHCNPMDGSYLSCPWKSFEDPLWREVKHYLDLKDIPGTMNINDSTDNIIYEAVLAYTNYFNNVDGYVISEEIKKREEERAKSKANAKPNGLPRR